MAARARRAAHDVDARKRTDDVLLPEGLDFGSLLLSPAVLDGLSSAGFRKPSPIQLKAIPLGRCGLGGSRWRRSALTQMIQTHFADAARMFISVVIVQTN